MIPLVPIDAGKVVGSVMQGLDALFTSDEERAAAKLAAQQALQHPHILQAMANIEAAKHPSLFVAGARPALLWLCVACLAYIWLFRDLLVMVLLAVGQTEVVNNLPKIESGDLMTIVLAMLGLGGMRTYEGIKGVKRENLREPTKRPLSGADVPPATLAPVSENNGVESFLSSLGIQIKPGVSLNGLDLPRMGPVLRAAAEVIPAPVVVTSAVRPNDLGSFHASGRALDFRTRHIPEADRVGIFRQMRDKLPSGYDLVLKDDPPHLHIEADRV